MGDIRRFHLLTAPHVPRRNAPCNRRWSLDDGTLRADRTVIEDALADAPLARNQIAGHLARRGIAYSVSLRARVEVLPYPAPT